jgi:hypothetical protein
MINISGFQGVPPQTFFYDNHLKVVKKIPSQGCSRLQSHIVHEYYLRVVHENCVRVVHDYHLKVVHECHLKVVSDYHLKVVNEYHFSIVVILRPQNTIVTDLTGTNRAHVIIWLIGFRHVGGFCCLRFVPIVVGGTPCPGFAWCSPHAWCSSLALVGHRISPPGRTTRNSEKLLLIYPIGEVLKHF